eukprot:scaffold1932_cov78-Skeletonema_dohrnii-CCMP3373.AAC.4
MTAIPSLSPPSYVASNMSSTNTKFSFRWTDEVLLYVLVHAKGDFDAALETILRHEATGRPPEDLMHLLSGGTQHYLEGSPSSHRRRRSYSESETDNNQNQSLRNGPDLFGQAAGMGGGGEQPIALNRNWSEGAVGPSYGSVPPSSSTLLLEGEGTETEADALSLSRPFAFDFERQQIRNLSDNTYDMCFEDPPIWVLPASSVSSTAAVANSSAQTGQDVPLTLNRPLSDSERRQTHIHIGDVDEAELPKSKHQQMLYMQSGIEASLKETRNTTANNTNADDEDLSYAYAVKVSKETFDEEYRKQELRNELENRMIKISLAESLSDPVMKSEEELIDEALRKSLTDTVEKSEELLLELARENSLKDMERIETIIKSEEELVEAAKQKSLLTMSKEEELIEAVKRQSLKSLSESVGKKSGHASMPRHYHRQSTSTTYPLCFAEDDSDISECSSSVEYPPPSRFDSLLGDSDVDLLDRKMPALVLPAAENCEEDQAHDDNRLRAMLEKSSSSVQHRPPSRFDSSLLEDSDLGLLDRKMPALVVPAAQNCGNDVVNSPRMNLPNVGSASTDVLSSASADQIKDKEDDSR